MAYKNKYGNVKVVFDGEKFDSKKEARRWAELKLLQRAGQIEFLNRQVPFVLIPSQYDDKTGKLIERAVTYNADFVYKENGDLVVEDCKGVRTKEYIIKRKLLLYTHGIRIREV